MSSSVSSSRAVTAVIGDTALPPASLSAASATIASVTGPVDRAARAARDAVVALAVADPASPLAGVPVDEVVTAHGHLFHVRDRARRDSCHAVFVEVRVHARLGSVRVTRAATAHDMGRVMNRRTARGQVLGGVTWGIGHALMEHTVYDRRTARVVNPNLSGYLVPVCADAPAVETHFIDRPDPASTALGARGFGETPVTGVPAAIGNAVHHATGRRVRDLPITRDELLQEAVTPGAGRPPGLTPRRAPPRGGASWSWPGPPCSAATTGRPCATPRRPASASTP